MRLNFTNFHEISSEIVSFQIRSAPQFHQFSSKIAHFQIRNFVRNGQISNKERGVPCRVGRSVGSPIRFFDPILNNALALRASHELGGSQTWIAPVISVLCVHHKRKHKPPCWGVSEYDRFGSHSVSKAENRPCDAPKNANIFHFHCLCEAE